MSKPGITALERRRRLADWIACEIMPHERGIRSWLGRYAGSPDLVDEVIQEAYCRLASLEAVDHIDVPRAYFFSIARNLLIQHMKRRRVVSFETFAEVEACRGDEPSPEDIASKRLDLARVTAFIARLPERCRTVVQLRKVEGWSQKQIAAHLGISEKAVEKQVWLGVKAIREAWARGETEADQRLTRSYRRRETGV